jgi:hypothetical protein
MVICVHNAMDTLSGNSTSVDYTKINVQNIHRTAGQISVEDFEIETYMDLWAIEVVVEEVDWGNFGAWSAQREKSPRLWVGEI